MSNIQFFKNPYDLNTSLMIQNLVKKVKEKETIRIKNRIKDNIHANLKRDKQMKKMMDAEQRGDQ